MGGEGLGEGDWGGGGVAGGLWPRCVWAVCGELCGGSYVGGAVRGAVCG